ncbi:MAG: SDR family oxidoreductase [Anaerolinea sp.]|nr:SDR family oxidoreductase [Anaerolinea sp.]
MGSFSGKHWIVTGGGSGMGLATATLLTKLGAQVALWDVNDACLGCAEAMGALGVVVDVTQPESVAAALAQTIAAFGKIDGVLNAAGIMRTGLLEAIDPAIQKRIVEINLGGSVIVAHAVIPYLKQTRGSLIFFGSVAAFYGTPEFATYAATKAGVLSLAQALRVELDAAGVHVGIFNPHFVNTPMMTDNHNSEATLARSKSIFVTQHEPDDMAKAIVHGVAARRFMIVPSWRERLIYALSRYAEFGGHMLMKMNWKG